MMLAEKKQRPRIEKMAEIDGDKMIDNIHAGGQAGLVPEVGLQVGDID